MKKKILILGIIMSLVLTACGPKKEKTKKDSPKNETNVTEVATTESKDKDSSKSASMGDEFKVKEDILVLNSIKKGSDYDDKDVVILNITWTNNSEDTTSFATSIGQKVFQDGQSLKSAIVMDGMSSENFLKEVRPGTKLENIECAFNTVSTGDLEIEFDEWITFEANPTLIKAPFPAQ